jgi:hypothetical protein
MDSFLISTHYTNYNPWIFALNVSALVFSLVPKLPQVRPCELHRLRQAYTLLLSFIVTECVSYPPRTPLVLRHLVLALPSLPSRLSHPYLHRRISRNDIHGSNFRWATAPVQH